jgi:hypothetical protein
MAKVTDAETAARWAKVERIAEGITDYGISKALRTYFLLYLPVGVIFLTGAGFLLSVLIFGNLREEWPTHLAIGLMLTMLGTMIGGFVYSGKRVNPQVRPQRSGALIWLNKDEQKSIRKQIYGRIPPIPEQLVVARGSAVQIRQSLTLFLLTSPAYMLIPIAQLLNAPDFPLNIMSILLLGLFIALFIMVAWQFRQTGRFLERTAASVNSESA